MLLLPMYVRVLVRHRCLDDLHVLATTFSQQIHCKYLTLFYSFSRSNFFKFFGSRSFLVPIPCRIKILEALTH